MSVNQPALRSEGAAVTAIVPVIDEEATIAMVVSDVARAVAADVIVVDGGSADGTAAAARSAGARVIEEPARGYGRACLAGAAAADGADVLLFIDGDGADVADQAPLLVDPVLEGRFDLMLGARARRRSEPGALALHQAVGNRVVARVLSARFGIRLTDVGPFRAIRSDVLAALAMREMTYGWPTEMIRNAARLGYRINEVPVAYRCRQAGASKVSGNPIASTRAGWHMLRVAIG